MALSVDNAKAAVERAVAADEVQIPAIRGVAGGLVYLIDDASDLGRFSEINFMPVEDGKAVTPAHLTRIDHVAQTVAYDKMLTWLLFYTSIFQARKTPMIDIIDPSGAVRSQMVESAEGALRITLKGVENRRTLAGHLIAEKFGCGIQDLALETGDIFATAEALKTNGFRPLSISPNYYGDVEARFGLEPDLTEKLKAANILYDRDEYFQLYSITMEDLPDDNL